MIDPDTAKPECRTCAGTGTIHRHGYTDYCPVCFPSEHGHYPQRTIADLIRSGAVVMVTVRRSVSRAEWRQMTKGMRDV